MGSTRNISLGDALGSVRQIVDSFGDVTLEKSYTPFGEVLSESGTGASVYGYTGEVTDPSGLVYLRARYYQPKAEDLFQMILGRVIHFFHILITILLIHILILYLSTTQLARCQHFLRLCSHLLLEESRDV